MFDGVLVINELMDLSKRFRWQCIFLKIDFDKDYESVSWNYLRSVMGLMSVASRKIRSFTRHSHARR